MKTVGEWADRAEQVAGDPDRAAEFVRRAVLTSSGRAYLTCTRWHELAAKSVDPGGPPPVHLVDGGNLARAAADDSHRRCMLAPRWMCAPMGVDGEFSPGTGMLRTPARPAPDGGLQVTWNADGTEAPAEPPALQVDQVGVALSVVVGGLVATIQLPHQAPTPALCRGDLLTVHLGAVPHAHMIWRELGRDLMVAPIGTPVPQ